MTNAIKFLIDDEIEAIAGYNKIIKQIDNPEVKHILEEIMMEEYKHISILRSIAKND